MKNLILSIVLIFTIVSIAWAGTLVKVWDTKAVATATNTTYTSNTYDVSNFGEVSYMLNTVGSDSMKITIKVQGYVGSSWQTVKTDVLAFGDATPSLKFKQVRLRTSSLDSLAGVSRIRFQAVVVPFAIADSTSATSYSINLLAR